MQALTSLPLATRGRDDAFARLLDGADGSAALAPGARLASRLCATGQALEPAVRPRPEFRSALRTRLLAVAAVQEAPVAVAAERTSRRGHRALGVAAGAMASFVAVGGVAAAGQQSLPGDPFYGVKRTVEALQLATADSDVDRGHRHLEFASTRMRELRGLTLGREAFEQEAPGGGGALRGSGAELLSGQELDPDVAERVRETLADMDAETRKGTELLTSAFRRLQAQGPLRDLSSFASRQSDELAQLLPSLPSSSQDRAAVSLALVAGLADDTEELLDLGTCGPGCGPSTTGPTGPTTLPGEARSTEQPCGCETPTPTPQDSGTPSDQRTPDEGAPPSAGSDTGTTGTYRSGSSSGPTSPSSEGPGEEPRPNPVPVPVPLPSNPLPVPTPLLRLPLDLPVIDPLF